MQNNKLYRLIFLLLTVGIVFLIIKYDWYLRKKSFYNQEIESNVCDINIDLFGRGSSKIILCNEIDFIFGRNEGIEVNDSIYKEANTYFFQIFKKDSLGDYKLFKTKHFYKNIEF